MKEFERIVKYYQPEGIEWGTCEYMDDSEELIRCKDCIYYEKYIYAELQDGTEKWDEICSLFRAKVVGDGFCAWAERKEEK